MIMTGEAILSKDSVFLEPTLAAKRARYYSQENNFDFSWPGVPVHQFENERNLAMQPGRSTGLVPLDLQSVLGLSYPATTPTLLVRYVNIQGKDSLTTDFVASGTVCYVIRGEGVTTDDVETIHWGPGDVFCFPGGQAITHTANAQDCLLFVATNEPLLSLERLRPPRFGDSRIEAVHWPSKEIERQFEPVLNRPITENTSGHAVVFSSHALNGSTNILPTINCAINTLEPGRDQRPHRHNGVAVTLSLQGEGVYSMIEDQRVDWIEYGVQITPGAFLHSHHNRGGARMRSLIIQDEALHYYTRTPGFSWT